MVAVLLVYYGTRLVYRHSTGYCASIYTTPQLRWKSQRRDVSLGSLTLVGSTLYGMTVGGGIYDGGVVFKINSDGTGYNILHNFTGGYGPEGSLTLVGSALYGMTMGGGSSGGGVVFKMNIDGSGYTILHTFVGGKKDGMSPKGSLTLSGSTLYGVTGLGGIICGTVFQMSTDGSGYTTIHNFTDEATGAVPRSLMLSGSTLYGTACNGAGTGDNGVLFALSLSTQIVPTIKANGTEGGITIDYPEALSIAVAMNTGDYAGVPVDWWVAARAGASWYYLNNLGQWIEEGNLLNWHPVYQGPLFDLFATQVLNITGLGAGSYTFYFAVDLPMNGILNMEQIWVDAVTVNVR